jgi:hypothetical protein
MSGSNDTKEDHGSREPPASESERRESGHSGHGSASAWARLRSQRKEWQQPLEADDVATWGG